MNQTELEICTDSLKKHIPSLEKLWLSMRGTKQTSNENISSKDMQVIGKALLELQRGLTGSRNLAGAGYMNDTSMLGAYLLYYWPISYMQTSLALSILKKSLFESAQKNKIFSILDLGSGPGPASAAVIDLLKQNTNEITIQLTLADSSTKALSLAKNILSLYNNVSVSIKTINLEKLTDNDFPNCRYDMILMSHALNELWKSSSDFILKRASLLDSLKKHLTADGILFVEEPALLETSRSLLAVRDELIKQNWHIIAPCMNSCLCPALSAGPSHTCHADIAWEPVEPVASLAKTAGLDRESVKMSFFTAVPGNAVNGQSEFNKNIIRARVTSDAMLNKAGRIRFLLCDGKTRFAFSAKNEDPQAKSAGFFSLRRYDLIEIANAELRGDKSSSAFGFTSATKIQIIERIGK